MCHGRFQGFSPETICSNQSFLVVCRIPLLAIHTPSQTPSLLTVVRNPTLYPLQVPSVTLLLHCFQHHQPIPPLPLPWELPRHIVLANHLQCTIGNSSLVLHRPSTPCAAQETQHSLKASRKKWALREQGFCSLGFHLPHKEAKPNSQVAQVCAFETPLSPDQHVKNTLKY